MVTEADETDAAVILRSRDDPHAFAAVFDRHYDAVHRFLWSRVGDDADDVAAEVFRVAFERRGDYDTAYPSAKPWLFGIASRLAKRQHRVRVRSLQLRDRASARTPRHDRGGPEQRLDELALSSPVAEALVGLHERDRDPLLLHAWEELTYDEIARALDLPVGTVRSRIHRARRVLRDHLGGRDPGGTRDQSGTPTGGRVDDG